MMMMIRSKRRQYLLRHFPQNDLGAVKTSDQKLFIIYGRENHVRGKTIQIRFFIKYDELKEIPKVKNIFLNGKLVCVNGLEEEISPPTNNATTPTQTSISLSELIGNSTSNVTKIPTHIDNVRKKSTNKFIVKKILLISVKVFVRKFLINFPYKQIKSRSCCKFWAISFSRRNLSK